jgi:hypothetical protein
MVLDARAASLSLTAVSGVAALHRPARPSKNQVRDCDMVMDCVEMKTCMRLRYIYFVVIEFEELREFMRGLIESGKDW